MDLASLIHPEAVFFRPYKDFERDYDTVVPLEFVAERHEYCKKPVPVKLWGRWRKISLYTPKKFEMRKRPRSRIHSFPLSFLLPLSIETQT